MVAHARRIAARGLAAALACAVLGATCGTSPGVGAHDESPTDANSDATGDVAPDTSLPCDAASDCPSGQGCEDGSCFVPDAGWVVVPAGEFLMGSPEDERGHRDNEALHPATIPHDYLIMTTEVTEQMWLDVMGEDRGTACGLECPVGMQWLEAVEFANQMSARDGRSPCYVVEAEDVFTYEVAWDDGCIGYRLPTEAEWEYAARAGTTTATYAGDLVELFGGPSPVLDPLAWYVWNSEVEYEPAPYTCGSMACGPHPVAMKEPNPWGLYDTLGNLWEWIWDPFVEEYPETHHEDDVPRRTTSEEERTWRGCSYNRSQRSCRSAARRGLPAWVDGEGVIGARLVRTLRP